MLNWKCFKTIVWPEYVWALIKYEEMKMKMLEMRMMYRLSRLDKIRNECTKRSLGVVGMAGKTKEIRLRW